MNKRTHILTGALAAAAVLLLGAASVGTGFSAWKTQVGVRAALSMQDGRQLALQEAALTVYQPAVQAAEQTPEEMPEAKAPEESAAAADNAQAPEETAAPEPAAASRAEDAQPAGEAVAEEAADAQAELLALAAPETAEPTALEPKAAEEGRTEAAEPEPLESAEPQTNESAAPEQPESEPAAAPKGTPVEVSRPQGLCAEYPEVTLQPGGWAEYQVVLVNEGTADAALPELEIPDLPEGLHCELPELPESGLLRAGERLTLTWIVHCEGEGRPVAFSVTAHLTQLPIAPAPSAAYTIVPGSGREEETP